MTGRVHSFQSLGTLDGPGVRYVVFLQGCPLRCSCCHNPDTWDSSGGTEYRAEEIIEKAVRFKSYFGAQGGITLSGGEPLLQAEFSKEIFRLAHENGINTCLDTSGCLLTDGGTELLLHTDRVLLDIKYTTDEMYRLHAGCSLNAPLAFLSLINRKSIPTTLRQVIIPSVNDNMENILSLKAISQKHPCVDKIELLPFRKLCLSKYETLGIPFPFSCIPEPDAAAMSQLNALLNRA